MALKGPYGIPIDISGKDIGRYRYLGYGLTLSGTILIVVSLIFL